MKPEMLKGFEPFNIGAGTRYLILGSFPSVKSLDGNFYYLHPQNKFYRIISQLFQEQFPVGIVDKKNLLIRCRIGLWDIISQCERSGSLDSAIKNYRVSDLKSISNIKSMKIGCTGKKSFELTRKYYQELNPTYLSSPSPANAKYFSMESWINYFGP